MRLSPTNVRQALLSSKDANLVALGHNLTDEQIVRLQAAFWEAEGMVKAQKEAARSE